MPFITGSANNVNEVLSALQNACTANGWKLTSGILSKGDCYAKPFISDGTIVLNAGTGQSGSNLINSPQLLSASTNWVNYYPDLMVSLSAINKNIAYPLTYSIHVMENPNEVYLFINHSVDNWSYIAFGQSPTANLTGTGTWYSGTGIGNNNLPDRAVKNNSNGHIGCGLFNFTESSGATVNFYQLVHSFFHHGVSDMPYEWSITGTEGIGTRNTQSWPGLPSQASATLTLMPLLVREPSQWNSGAALLPIQPSIARPDNRRYIVGNLGHARYARIDNINPGEIVTIGSEKWRFYPWLKKNIVNRNATVTDSGTYAAAIRYDGD